MANVELPAALRVHAGNHRQITVAAATVGAALQEVQLAHPALQGFLVDSQGVVPRHVVIFVDNTDIRHGLGLATTVSQASVITVLLPVAGGAGADRAGASETIHAALSRADIERYGRQILLPWMSGRAQQRFGAARAAIELSANDIASHWLSMYLAYAGVGHLQLQGPTPICDGPIEQGDVLGSPLLRTHDLGAPRAQRLQQLLTQRVPRLDVSIEANVSARSDGAATGTAHPASAALYAHGNGSITHAMWHGSQVAASWLRHTATHRAD